MIKSKHFRKDVIIARVIFLCASILLIVGIVWLVSKLDGESNPGEKESQSNLEENTGTIDSESESESESESASETESQSETESTSESEPEADTKLYVVITSSKNLNLRTEPNTSCDVITSIPNGGKAEIIEELDGWFKVSYKGHEGYVSADYVKVVEE